MRNTSKTVSFRSTKEVDRQLSWLSVRCGENKSRIIQRAIDILYHNCKQEEKKDR